MLKNIKKEIKEFNKIIKKYPNIKEFYLGRAILYTKIKQYKKAVQDYEKAYKNYFCQDIISICERNGLTKEAEEFYTKAINTEKSAKNYINRSYFYARICEKEKALNDLKTSLKLSPKEETILSLANILTKKTLLK